MKAGSVLLKTAAAVFVVLHFSTIWWNASSPLWPIYYGLGVLLSFALIVLFRPIGAHIAQGSEKHMSKMPELFPPKRPEDGVKFRLVSTQLGVLVLGIGSMSGFLPKLYELLTG